MKELVCKQIRKIKTFICPNCSILIKNVFMKKKNAEVQSRREFFKKAIKSTLPILAIMALPSILTSCEPDDDDGGGSGSGGSSSSGCKNCGATCSVNCASGCRAKAIYSPSTCKGSCRTACYSCRSLCYGSSK